MTRNERSVFETPLTRSQVELRLRPFNGEFGREGGRFAERVVIAAVDAKGFRLSMARNPMWMRQATATGRWEPTGDGSRFNLKTDPVFSNKVSAIRFGLIALLVSLAAIADLMVIRQLNLNPPPAMAWAIGMITSLLVFVMYLWLLDPIVIRRTTGEFESQQVDLMKRFVAEILGAREILNDSVGRA